VKARIMTGEECHDEYSQHCFGIEGGEEPNQPCDHNIGGNR
jgi:hypothetical protein